MHSVATPKGPKKCLHFSLQGFAKTMWAMPENVRNVNCEPFSGNSLFSEGMQTFAVCCSHLQTPAVYGDRKLGLIFDISGWIHCCKGPRFSHFPGEILNNGLVLQKPEHYYFLKNKVPYTFHHFNHVNHAQSSFLSKSISVVLHRIDFKKCQFLDDIFVHCKHIFWHWNINYLSNNLLILLFGEQFFQFEFHTWISDTNNKKILTIFNHFIIAATWIWTFARI